MGAPKPQLLFCDDTNGIALVLLCRTRACTARTRLCARRHKVWLLHAHILQSVPPELAHRNHILCARRGSNLWHNRVSAQPSRVSWHTVDGARTVMCFTRHFSALG